MATYTDPQTGERREVDDLVRRPTNYGSSWGVIALLIVAAALAAWYFYGRATPTVDNTNTSTTMQSSPQTNPANPAAPSQSTTTAPAQSPSTTPAAPSNNNPAAPAPTAP